MVGHEFFFSLSPLFLDPLHVDKRYFDFVENK